jgi:hypothetical protein
MTSKRCRSSGSGARCAGRVQGGERRCKRDRGQPKELGVRASCTSAFPHCDAPRCRPLLVAPQGIDTSALMAADTREKKGGDLTIGQIQQDVLQVGERLRGGRREQPRVLPALQRVGHPWRAGDAPSSAAASRCLHLRVCCLGGAPPAAPPAGCCLPGVPPCCLPASPLTPPLPLLPCPLPRRPPSSASGSYTLRRRTRTCEGGGHGWGWGAEGPGLVRQPMQAAAARGLSQPSPAPPPRSPCVPPCLQEEVH